MSLKRTFPTNKKKEEKKKSPPKKGILAIERRKHPRFNVELPLDYIQIKNKGNYGGIVANASEIGVLVYLPEKVKIGTLLKIEIFYVRDFALNTINAIGKVVWSDVAAIKKWGDYRYGLQFQSVDKKNFIKLKGLLEGVEKSH